MNPRLLIFFFLFVSCEKEPEIVSFKFINSSPDNIDTLYLNGSGRGTHDNWTKVILDFQSRDTAEYIKFETANEPLYAKAISGSESFLGYFKYGSYDPSNPSIFDPGSYIVTIFNLDTAKFIINYEIQIE